MNHRYFSAVITIAAIYGLLAGCAAGRRNALEPAVPLLLKKPPVLLAANTNTNLIAQNEPGDDDFSLLEDDLAWDDSETEEIYAVADPLEKWNRAMFVFNDKLYFWMMKPAAQGYRFVVPPPARSGVKNFFFNASAPIRVVNNILQGKGHAAEAEVARFLYNATLGLLGFGNPAAKHPELNPPVEDLGQTLAKYGFIDGFFIMWPFLGPSTLRDSAGTFGDRFLNPFGYVEPVEASLAIGAYDVLNDLSFRIGDYESLKQAALDPYEAYRNGYIQLRQLKIKQ
ncbi:MAG: VacJ family lipoprotein [Desulfatitalea sp.]|nr:VacJ family lipoprotein [Desulfatitalea sp.]NNK01508.1 VacJ family lipoprotein [Desulfatitalea sp.]